VSRVAERAWTSRRAPASAPAANRPARLSALVRLDHAAIFAVCAALLVVHRADVRWGWFAALFALIDLVGFAPGALLHRARGAAPGWARRLYNLAHGAPFALALAAGYSALRGGPDWTLLALPLHLCADRGLLGNGFKRAGDPFL
jgi:hypothetical protein